MFVALEKVVLIRFHPRSKLPLDDVTIGQVMDLTRELGVRFTSRSSCDVHAF